MWCANAAVIFLYVMYCAVCDCGVQVMVGGRHGGPTAERKAKYGLLSRFSVSATAPSPPGFVSSLSPWEATAKWAVNPWTPHTGYGVRVPHGLC